MKINKKLEKKWQEWETMMEGAEIFLNAARDLGSTVINEDGTVTCLSSEKIQLTIDQLKDAKELVEKLEFAEEIVITPPAIRDSKEHSELNIEKGTDSDKQSSIFSGMTFKRPPISKEEFNGLYEDYVRRAKF